MRSPRIMLAIGLFSAIVAVTVGSEPSSPSRLYRTLTGTKEQAKLRALSALRQNADMRSEALVDLVAAVTTIATELARNDTVQLTETTAILIQQIGAIDDPRATETLLNLLEAKRMEVAMISADVLGQINCRAALPALKQQTQRSEFATNYGFRFGLFRAIAQIEDPAAVEFLTDSLPTLNGQLAFEVQKFLDQITLDHFRGDQAKFDEWSRQRSQRIAPVTYSQYVPSDYDQRKYEQPHYYGIGIHAQKIVFVIDHSGSMKEVVYRDSRIMQAKRELIRAIRSLPETTEFTIILFESGVRRWKKNLVEASDRNKKAAIRYVGRIRCGGGTNTYGGLRTALNMDDDIEAIYLLSDGAPTQGKLEKPEQIIEAIGRQNAFRHVAINTIGISPKEMMQRFMRELATQNGGEYKTAD